MNDERERADGDANEDILGRAQDDVLLFQYVFMRSCPAIAHFINDLPPLTDKAVIFAFIMSTLSEEFAEFMRFTFEKQYSEIVKTIKEVMGHCPER